MEEKKVKVKKPFYKRWWFIAIVVIIVIGALGGGGDDEKNNDNLDTANVSGEATNNDDSKNKEEAAEIEVPPAIKLEPYQTELSAGHYTSGIDFPVGIYTITAVSGSGNVSSSNMFSGGLNETMSSEPNEMYIDVFKNAKLENGVVLSVGGDLIIDISSNEANISDLQSRTNELTETVELSSGNYIAGTDFPAGLYNIVAINGSGNVNSDNMFDGGLNEVMASSAKDMYINEFKNAELSEGTTLSISGVTIQLIPSK